MLIGNWLGQTRNPTSAFASRSARTTTCRALPRASQTSDSNRPRTLYGLLGIKSNANKADVRAAYRSAARRLHPDTNPSPAAQEDFQRIKAAYEVLGDGQLRRLYDNFGFSALGPKYADLASYLKAGAKNAEGETTRAAGLGVRGRDVHTVLGILLSEAAQGADKVVSYEAHTSCSVCQGSGYATSPPPCPVCRGTGEVLRSEFSGAAVSGQYGGPKLLALATCPACAGEGAVSQPACRSCRGRGRRKSLRELALRIPAGVERGQLLRFRGEGGAGRCGGPPGDLLVRLEVYSEANLERRGDDLHSGLQVDVFSAVLGATVAVDTVRGRRLLDVPPGAQPGDVLRLAGAGVVRAAPDGGGGVVRGDHIFTLSVTLPNAEQLCGTSQDLLRRLARIRSAAGQGQGPAAGRRPAAGAEPV